MIECNVCGRKFRIGNNPINGLPNGIGMKFEKTGDKVFNVCSVCMCYNYKKVTELVEKFKEENRI